jgi:hypothetical protein
MKGDGACRPRLITLTNGLSMGPVGVVGRIRSRGSTDSVTPARCVHVRHFSSGNSCGIALAIEVGPALTRHLQGAFFKMSLYVPSRTSWSLYIQVSSHEFSETSWISHLRFFRRVTTLIFLALLVSVLRTRYTSHRVLRQDPESVANTTKALSSPAAITLSYSNRHYDSSSMAKPSGSNLKWIMVDPTKSTYHKRLSEQDKARLGRMLQAFGGTRIITEVLAIIKTSIRGDPISRPQVYTTRIGLGLQAPRSQAPKPELNEQADVSTLADTSTPADTSTLAYQMLLQQIELHLYHTLPNNPFATNDWHDMDYAAFLQILIQELSWTDMNSTLGSTIVADMTGLGISCACMPATAPPTSVPWIHPSALVFENFPLCPNMPYFYSAVDPTWFTWKALLVTDLVFRGARHPSVSYDASLSCRDE